MKLIISLVFLSFFLLSLFFGSVFLFIVEKNGNYEEDIAHVIERKYQYFERDYHRKESSFGIVSLFEEISEFVSYDDYELQKSVLISPFGTEEFECHGGCYCENDDFRRISRSKLLIEGVSYLLASVSSVVAFDLAKEFFSEKCSEKYSNYCESKSIKSEVHNCEKVVQDDYFEEREMAEKRVYFCYGNCLDRVNPNPTEYRPTASVQGFDCKKLKQEGEMVIYSNELVAKTSKMALSSRMRKTARKKFQQYHLVDFCKENSQIQYEYQKPTYHILASGERKKYVRIVEKFASMCAGVSSPKSSGKSDVQNVRCRQIDPKPTAVNSAWLDKKWWEEKEEWDEY